MKGIKKHFVAKDIKRHLVAMEKEIIEGKKVVQQKKRAVRKAGTVAERENEMRVLTNAMQGVEQLKEQREVLEDIAVKKSSGRRRAKSNRRSTSTSR